jgi:hypothetical protein
MHIKINFVSVRTIKGRSIETYISWSSVSTVGRNSLDRSARTAARNPWWSSKKKEPDITDDDNTLKVVDKDGDVTSLKVEHGSIKIGYYEDNDWKWEATPYILVTYPNHSEKGSMYIIISYKDGVHNHIWTIRYEYLSKITSFLNTLVNAGKLVDSLTRGSGIIYKANAKDTTEGSTKLGGGTNQYMGQLNPYLLHKTDST